MPTLARIFKMKQMRETPRRAPQKQEKPARALEDFTKDELGKMLDDSGIEYSPQQLKDELVELLRRR